MLSGGFLRIGPRKVGSFGTALLTIVVISSLVLGLAGCAGLVASKSTASVTPATLSVTITSLSNAQTAVAYSATLTAAGGTAPYSWSISAGTLPAGLTLNSVTGVLSGTPTQTGSFSFTVQVTDASPTPQMAAQPLGMVVSTSPALAITTAALPAGQVGAGYSATLAATGGTTPYTWSVATGSSLPSGISLNASTGALSGTPTTAGTSSFSIQVRDSGSTAQTATKAFSVTISAVGSNPVSVTTSSLASGRVGTAYSATLIASGGTTPYTWSVANGSLPAGIGLNAATGGLSGTPTAAGTSSFTIQVRDSSSTAQTATKALSVTISAASPAPLSITTTSLAGGQVGTAYSAALSASGGTTPYTWSVSTGTLPAGVGLNAATGGLSGTPTTVGTSSFTIQVRDSSSTVQTATKALSVTIAAAGPAPLSITTSSVASAQVGTAYAAALAASGGTTPYTWSVATGSSLPAGLTLGGNGAFSGTPTQAGSFTFTVQVRDSSSSVQTASKQYTITVTSAAPSPLQLTSTSVPGGQVSVPFSATLTASGGIAPYTWSVSSGALPAGLTLGASNGQISGTPTQAGSFPFTIQVRDSTASPQTASQAFTATINAAGSGTSLTSCGTLATAGATYILQNDVSSAGTCFTIAAGSIIFNLNGHTITYGTSSGGAQVFGIYGCFQDTQCPGGGGSNFGDFTVYNGTISMDPSVTAGDSNNLRLDGVTAAGTIHDIVFNTWGQNTIPLKVRYYNGGAGHQIYNNTFNDNTSGSINRSEFAGMAIKLDNVTGPPAASIHNNTITNAPMGGVYLQTPGSVVDSNNFTFIGQYSNDFGVVAQGPNIEVKNNTVNAIDGRGIFSSGGCFVSPCTTGSPNIKGINQLIHGNVIDVWEAGYNAGSGVTPIPLSFNAVTITQGSNTVTGLSGLAAGYGSSGTPTAYEFCIGVLTECHGISSNTATSVTTNGNWAAASGSYAGNIYVVSCGSFGVGTYGIQFDDTSSLNTVYNNTITAHSAVNANGTKCASTGLRLTTFGVGNQSHDNIYKQVNDPGADGYDNSGNMLKGGALGFEANGAVGTFTSTRDTFIGDNASIWFEDLGLPQTAGFTCIQCTLGKGSNPRAGSTPYVTFHFWNYRPTGPVYNVHMIDTTFTGGAAKDSTDLTAISANAAYGEYYIDWTYTLTVQNSGGSALPGTAITIVDALGGTAFTGTTDANGQVSVVLNEFHMFSTGSGVTKQMSTPHVISGAGTGCTVTAFSANIAQTTSQTVTCQ